MPIQPDVQPNDVSVLTASQRAAVEHVDGPLLILAGPGSGKTRVVTHRIAHMLRRGITDSQIVALTFTNKAADEMRSRLERLVPGSQVWTGTFHRFCARLLRRYASLVGLRENYSIYDTQDSLKLLKESIRDAGVELVHETPQRIAWAISCAKSDLTTFQAYEPAFGDPVAAIVARVYPEYQKRLLTANAVDFDDLLCHLATLLRENPELRASLDDEFHYILVDEYQDTNFAQYAIVRAISVDHPNLAVTGDPDQSIYGWRGATIRNILEFERDFPNVRLVRLEQNYRSTKSILRVADQLIANNRHRKEKQLYTDNEEGMPVRLVVYRSGSEEAQTIAARMANEVASDRRRARDFAILYRTNAISRSFERALTNVGLPYQIVRGLEFYQRQEIKDILAYLHLLNNPDNDVALLRTFNRPPRHIGKVTIHKLSEHARRHNIPLMRAARESGLVHALAKRSAVEVARFVAMFDSLRSVATESVEEILGHVFDKTGYRQWLTSSELPEDRERLDNLGELLTDGREFDETHIEDGGLEAFLERTSLVTDVDEWSPETDRVTLMTLHAAKGLEFPVAHVVALEDDLLPHDRSKEFPKQVEEERRLLFVGMTRAQQELHLSCARTRSIGGRKRHASPSRFLMELPREEMEVIGNLQVMSGDDFDPDVPWDVAPDEEPSFSVNDVPEAETGTQPAKKKLSAAAVTTAAQMLAKGETPARYSPEAFEQGMIVSHPRYGLGTIVALGGSRRKRMATVQFFSETETIRFSLVHSELKPATP